MPCSLGSEVKSGQSGSDLVLIRYQDFGISNYPDPADLLPFGLTPNDSGGYDVNTRELLAPEQISLYGVFYSDLKSNFCAGEPPSEFPGASPQLEAYLAVVARYKWNEFCQCKVPPCRIPAASTEECRAFPYSRWVISYVYNPNGAGFTRDYQEWGDVISATAVAHPTVANRVILTTVFSMPGGREPCTRTDTVQTPLPQQTLPVEQWTVTATSVAVVENDRPTCYIEPSPPPPYVCPAGVNCYAEGDELIIVVDGQPGQDGTDGTNGTNGIDGVCLPEDCMLTLPVLREEPLTGHSGLNDVAIVADSLNYRVWGVKILLNAIPVWAGRIPGAPPIFDLGVFAWRDSDLYMSDRVIISSRQNKYYRSGLFPATGFLVNLRPGFSISSLTLLVEDV